MEQPKKHTLILGASDNPERYSYLALQRLKNHGHPVTAIGRKSMEVLGTPVLSEKVPVDNIDTVTLYMNPTHQKEYYDYILSLQPKRLIFNPGTENDELAEKAKEAGIQTLEACTLVLLGTGQY